MYDRRIIKRKMVVKKCGVDTPIIVTDAEAAGAIL
jgi:hypothetical protein